MPYPQDKGAVLKVLEDIWHSDHGVDAFARIKRAWNAHSHKKKGNKRTFSFVLPVDVAMRLKQQARAFKKPQSTYLVALILRDGSHLARLKEDYKSKIARSKQIRSTQSDKEESRHLSRLRSENERKSALIKQYEARIHELVRAKLLSEALTSRGLEEEAELDDDSKLAMWVAAEDQAAEYLEGAHLEAMDPANQDPSGSPF